MVETGHRYMVLYWAGLDSNWEFAVYQLGKIQHTIELGIERRPKRGPSAHGFLKEAVPQLWARDVSKNSACLHRKSSVLLCVPTRFCSARWCWRVF